MIKKINKLKEKINRELENKLPIHEDVVKLSQELDLILLEYYNRNNMKVKPNNENEKKNSS